MNLLETLIKLRDDLKDWITANINALNAKIDSNTIPIDNKLNAESTNPIQNQAVSKALDDLSDKLENQPHNYHDLEDAPSIEENEQEHLIVTDDAGNIIFKIDSNGTHTTKVSIDGTDLHGFLSKKVDAVQGKGLSTNDYTDQDKAKLALLNSDAVPISIDSALSITSENPVKNKVITEVFNAHINDTFAHPDGIQDDNSAEFVIVDANSNVIMKIDSYGVHTTDTFLNGSSVQNMVDSRFEIIEAELIRQVKQEVLNALPKYNGGAYVE